jgi:hypothetical protein
MKRLILILASVATALVFVEAQTEKLDYATIGRIRDEGLNRSQVMDHVSWLSDVYGPRLTGSPAIMQASEWVIKKVTEWGLTNAHREPWKFGKGWSLVRFSAHLVEPQIQPLIGFPIEWSTGTKGTVTGDVVRVQIATEATSEVPRQARRQGRVDAAGPASASARGSDHPAHGREMDQGSGNDAGPGGSWLGASGRRARGR